VASNKGNPVSGSCALLINLHKWNSVQGIAAVMHFWPGLYLLTVPHPVLWYKSSVLIVSSECILSLVPQLFVE